MANLIEGSNELFDIYEDNIVPLLKTVSTDVSLNPGTEAEEIFFSVLTSLIGSLRNTVVWVENMNKYEDGPAYRNAECAVTKLVTKQTTVEMIKQKMTSKNKEAVDRLFSMVQSFIELLMEFYNKVKEKYTV